MRNRFPTRARSGMLMCARLVAGLFVGAELLHAQAAGSRSASMQVHVTNPVHAPVSSAHLADAHAPNFLSTQGPQPQLAATRLVGDAKGRATQPQAAAITVTGDVSQPLTLSATDLATFPRATVTTISNGISTTYGGVWLVNVLKKAGVSVGSGMRGKTLSGYVLATATDGYQVLFSLGEVDQDLSDGEYLLADSADGKPLFGENGAFRLIVPRDKRGARSIRMLSSLKVTQLLK